MSRFCSNCHQFFDSSGKYCSSRCARAVRRQKLQVLCGVVVGTLILAWAIYTAPRSAFRPEPNHAVSTSELQKLACDESCPICTGKGKVDCKICIDGKIFYMGTNAECNRCRGKGCLICPICKGSGKLRDALAAVKT